MCVCVCVSYGCYITCILCFSTRPWDQRYLPLFYLPSTCWQPVCSTVVETAQKCWMNSSKRGSSINEGVHQKMVQAPAMHLCDTVIVSQAADLPQFAMLPIMMVHLVTILQIQLCFCKTNYALCTELLISTAGLSINMTRYHYIKMLWINGLAIEDFKKEEWGINHVKPDLIKYNVLWDQKQVRQRLPSHTENKSRNRCVMRSQCCSCGCQS